jgi:hypothetical protein
LGQILVVDVIGPLVAVVGYVLLPLCWAVGLLANDYFLAYVARGVQLRHPDERAQPDPRAESCSPRSPGRATWPTLAAIAVVENFGYRQLCNLWRVWGWYQYLRKQEGWGPMQRQEFKQV